MKTALSLAKALVFAGFLGLAVISLAGEAGRFLPLLDTVNHFRPFLMAAALVLLPGLFLFFRRPHRYTATFWLAALTFGLQGAALAPELIRSAVAENSTVERPAARADIVRLVSFNVWGRNSEQADAVEALMALDADVIVLQEMWRKQRPIAERLAKAYPYRADCIGVSLCNIAVLSRHPIARDQVRLPVAQGPARRLPSPHIHDWTVPLVRADLLVPIAGRTVELSVFGTHLTWPIQVPRQRNQMDQLARAVAAADRARSVVMGDFNSTPWSYGLAHLGAGLGLERVSLALPTWPAERRPQLLNAVSRKLTTYGLDTTPLKAPFLPIDHAFIGEAFDPVSVSRARLPGSDHHAVVVDLAMRDAEQ